MSKDCSTYEHKSVNYQNTARIYYVSGSVLSTRDMRVKPVSTLKEFTALKRKSDQNKRQRNKQDNFRYQSMILR